LGNPYGIKVRCYWGHFGEQLGNLESPVLTPWKHIGNMMGTRKESKKFLPFYFIFKTVGHQFLSNGMARRCPQKI
jgi:hypothetical protein